MGKRNNIRRTAHATEAAADLARRAEIGRRLQLTPAQLDAEDAAVAVLEAAEARTKLVAFAAAAGFAAGVFFGMLVGSWLVFLVCFAGGVAIAVVVHRATGPDKPRPAGNATEVTAEIPRMTGGRHHR